MSKPHKIRSWVVALLIATGSGPICSYAQPLTLSPPAVDYQKLCVDQAEPSITMAVLALQQWDGKQKPALDRNELYRVAMAYYHGNAQLAPDRQTAIRIFEYVVDQGLAKHVEAKVMLGKALLADKAITQDLKRARQLLHEAAQRQSTAALRALGDVYREGLGVSQDYTQAADYYRAAAGGGDTQSMFALASLYQDGLLAPPTPDAAKRMIQLAVITLMTSLGQGNCSVLFRIGNLYRRGLFLPQNDALAEQWLGIAAETGSWRAMQTLADMYLSGKGVEQSIEKALDFYLQAADLGSAQAMFSLGELYTHGAAGIAPERAKAEHWLARAADYGETKAMPLLAEIYAGDYGEPVDYQQAAVWLQRAVNQPLPSRSALTGLATAYAQGLGVSQDYQRAFELYQQAAALGSLKALVALAAFYQDGLGVARDGLKARRLFRQAASRGSTKALDAMVAIYTCGIDTESDPAKARKWLDRAAANGSNKAILQLADVLAMDANASGQQRRFRLIKRAAKNNSRAAMIDVGLAYLNGIGVATNPERAQLWFDYAIEPGPDAGQGMVRLVQAYLDGFDVVQTPAEAFALLQQAVALGNARALVELGKLQLSGAPRMASVISIDIDNALALLQQAVAAGNTTAMMTLYKHFLKRSDDDAPSKAYYALLAAAQAGEINAMIALAQWPTTNKVPAGTVSKAQWLQRAEAAGPCSVSETLQLAQAYFDGVNGEADLARARYWVERTLTHPLLSAADLKQIADFYHQGIGIGGQPDASKAVHYLSQAATRGNVAAMRNLGRLYLKGELVEADPAKAYGWFEKAAQQGDLGAKVELGLAYANGSGSVERDLKSAWQFMQAAAEQGSSRAMRELGRWYQFGLNVEPDPSQSMRWFNAAADHGDVPAMFELANAYAAGYGVNESPQRSLDWLVRAAQAGSPKAMYQLGLAYFTGYAGQVDQVLAQKWFSAATDAGYDLAPLVKD